MPSASPASERAVEACSRLRSACQPRAVDQRSVRETPAWFEQARLAVSDLYVRSAPVYWIDFTLTAAAAWTLAAVYLFAPAWSPIQIAAYLGSIVLFFRAGTFIHELVHVRQFYRYGGPLMWLAYLFLLVRDGYRKNVFEVEARAVEAKAQKLRRERFLDS